MDQLSKKIGIDGIGLSKILDFLPYPFLVSEIREDSQQNIFVNRNFIEEIGYSCEEIPTITEWFEQAYPDLGYRDEIMKEWRRRVDSAKDNQQESVIMQAKIHTKKYGDKWYEIKASIQGPIYFVAFVNIDDEITREQKLRILNENKNRVLSILSHDLRSPIINLRAVLHLISQGSLTENEKNEMFTKLDSQVFQISEFIDTTLHWAKVNFSEMKLRHQPVDVKAVVNTILSLYSESCLSKRIKISVSIDSEVMPQGDHEIFSILVRNIISNAIKYTPISGSIDIYNSRKEQKYVLAIENSGTGISREKISMILEKNYTSERGTQGEKGLGLGLRLCQQLLDKIEGSLEIESPDPSKTIVRIIV